LKSKFTKHRDETNERITKPEELVWLYDLLIQVCLLSIMPLFRCSHIFYWTRVLLLVGNYLMLNTTDCAFLTSFTFNNCTDVPSWRSHIVLLAKGQKHMHYSFMPELSLILHCSSLQTVLTRSDTGPTACKVFIRIFLWILRSINVITRH